ncbi:FAD-dependent oxidoreductase [Corallococcus exiguus]|uniref:hydroxysqualene dehydroxylase n=1 Tax=Corallococcus exiguus TaxID=83462 RepID=UPI001493E6A0|nr:FAD-dependent oxidoreductase [Corallococcus exiguus]NPC70111.1 FAD-dependent oxidoreductase [Corallococcus exiguus]
MPSVIVVGGGVAGLTVAHELVERGFEVQVFDTRTAWGGKARSQPVAGTGTNGRRDLPGEHGFRFYPRFYRHVIDMMQRTPAAPGSATPSVEQHLKATTESAIALIDEDTWYRFSRRKLDKPYDVLEALELFFQKLDFDKADSSLYSLKILQFLSSSEARRFGQYERMSWWDFAQGDLYSPKFQRQLRAVPRTMVAMDPQRGSARTIGAISMQLILDFAQSGVNNDRTMGGPTSQMWLEPWIAHLRGLGVQFHAGVRCTGLDVAGGRIAGVRFANGESRTADHYVLAVPLEAAHALMTPELAALDPALARLRAADVEQLVSWMVGIQFFLYEDVPLVRGHTFYPDSPWALTSISQPQFWRELGLFRRVFGDGQVGGLLSIDVSDWNTPGTFVPKRAKDCTPEEIKTEVWGQLKAALNGLDLDEQVLTDELLHSFHLDADLDYGGGLPPRNSSGLLVHPPGSWDVRPEAASAIPNLCLAGDYVRTHTDLASMEGACEAGRRAVNAILDRTQSQSSRALIWPLEEPEWVEPWKRLDAALYQRGRPHLFELLGLRTAVQASDVLRRFAALTGLTDVDDWLDQFRVSSVVDALLERLGID